MTLLDWFRTPKKDPAPPESGEAPRENVDLKRLRERGVKAWNRFVESKKGNYTPNFTGVDFNASAPGTRIWGKPSDLVGIERVVLHGINLSHGDLRGCKMGAVVLSEDNPPPPPKGKAANAKPSAPAIRPGADLRKAILVGADMSGNATMLNGVNFEQADLTEAHLAGANLMGANFARASLRNANLVGATLKGANFAWADLTGAVTSADALKQANLFGAKLAHVYVDGLNPRWLVFGRQILGARVSLTMPAAVN